MKPSSIHIEIGHGLFRLLHGEEGLETPLERLDNGRLTPACADSLGLILRGFLKTHGRGPRPQALCALGSRGVSLRRFTLPAASAEEAERLLLLQIESSFPIPPEELAWASAQVEPEDSPRNGANSREWLVAAVKRETVAQYTQILEGCGLEPVYTLAAFARAAYCPRSPGPRALLDIGRGESEFVSIEDGLPSNLRVIPLGAEALDSLADCLPKNLVGRKLCLTGERGGMREAASRLSNLLGAPCEWVETPSGKARSAAVLGLRKSEEEGGAPLPRLRVGEARVRETIVRSASWQWAALAAALLLGLLALRYAEAIVQRPRLARKMADIQAYRDRLPKVDRELEFLQYLKTNQPAYLDPIFIVANAAPPGAKLEALSVNRRGELSVRVAVGPGDQASDFRSKLIDSGFFSTVVFEEQSPSPDNQRMVVRLTAQCKPVENWEALVAEAARKSAPPGGPNTPPPPPGGAAKTVSQPVKPKK